MALEYLKETTFTIPSGYTIAQGAMTADSRRVYFAASHATQPQMLVYDMDGDRQETAEFGVIDLGTAQTYDAIAYDAENLYLVSNSPALGTVADVYPYTQDGIAGRQFALETIADDIDSLFEEVRGAAWINDEIVVLLERTVRDARFSVARFKADGSYVQDSFVVLGLPSDADSRSMVLAGQTVFVLDDTRLLALDRGFGYQPGENVALESGNSSPVSGGWNGNAVLVYDSAGAVYFYGTEQVTATATTSMAKAQYRSRAFRKHEETFDVLKRNGDGTVTARSIAIKALRHSTIEDVFVDESADLNTPLQVHTIIPKYPINDIELDDYFYDNTGATEDDPPTVLGATGYQVKGFGEWGRRSKQMLYCVQVRADGEVDRLAGAHSPLRVRNRR